MEITSRLDMHIAGSESNVLAGGTYDVVLTVTDNDGATDSTAQQVSVTDGNALPTADFSFTISGLSVDFTDASSDPDGSISTWSWDFGDGSSSTQQNPSHTYAVPGTYDVVLTVTDNEGASDALGRQITVNDGSGASEIYVSDLTGSAGDDGSNWIANVTITIMDDAGNPVPNALVSGSWSKGLNTTSSCSTDGSGQCMVEQTEISDRTRRVTFTIDEVSHTTLTYNPLLNTVSEIRINQP